MTADDEAKLRDIIAACESIWPTGDFSAPLRAAYALGQKSRVFTAEEVEEICAALCATCFDDNTSEKARSILRAIGTVKDD